ncbi:MAG: SDR family NAD(P)-dependent oxidoreductase [Bacillales bacterium]|nr:SDR family NAD(P)-dependent oxidoreductase [Bacillales bacterium]
MKRLEGKVCIITGANSGVGAKTAELFASEGAKVVITARRQELLDEEANKIRELGGEVLAIRTDVSKEEDVINLVKKTVEVYGTVDVLMNNAGVLEVGLKPIDRFLVEDVDRDFSINTKGTMFCTREVTKVMLEKGKGSIINLDSVAGECGCGGAAYVASKAAVVGLTKHTALRFAGKGIRCNSVCPGSIITPMTMTTDPSTLDIDMITQMRKHADLTIRPCMPEEVAKVCLFLASDDSMPITGQVIVCDHGANL